MNKNLDRAYSVIGDAQKAGAAYVDAMETEKSIALDRQKLKAEIITRLCTGDNGKAFADPRTGKAYTPTSAGDAASVEDSYMNIKVKHAAAELDVKRCEIAYTCAKIAAEATARFGDVDG